MCTQVFIPDETLLIARVGQMRARVGAENVHLSEEGAEGADQEFRELALSDNACLCHVDIERAAASIGFRCDWDSDPIWCTWVRQRAEEV